MPIFQDQTYLTSEQYKDSGNLDARIRLHERFSTNHYGWFHWVFDQFNLPPKAKILELGCGSGALWMVNYARIPLEWHINLSDFSSGMVKECQVKLNHISNQFSFVTSNAMDIPYPENSFDSVIANHMLYHVPNRQKALCEITRVLKPEGHLYAATNGENHLRELDMLCEKYSQATEKGLFGGKPSGYFSLENGAAQLAPWFTLLETRYYPDALKVTETEPLMSYIHSMIPGGGNLVDRLQNSRLYQSIEEQIQQQGYVYIQKSSGLFIGRI
jgi:ubiquinone/menaquinone biosynthesis C-methylase UbiE